MTNALRAQAGALALAIGLVATTVSSQSAPKPAAPAPPSGRVVFKAVSDLSYPLSDTTVIGARPANPNEFRASFYSESAAGACTSTMVGPRALLTAAHCVANRGQVTLKRGTEEWTGTCEHAGDYRDNETADWALCLLDREMKDVPVEQVNIDPGVVTNGGSLLLTGFGCTERAGAGHNDGIYRIGDAVVRRLPDGSNNDIMTRAKGTATAALCFGDSGGPAFVYLDRIRRRRVQVGVNSRANIRDVSYIASTSTPQALDFMRGWADNHRVDICGVSDDKQGCQR